MRKFWPIFSRREICRFGPSIETSGLTEAERIMATVDEFPASLDVDFDFGEAHKGKRFEVFCKWFLEIDPEWSKTAEHQPVIY